jgi:mitogen-activated protein kinase kinase kinase
MTGHLLVYTHTIEDEGVYVVAHPSLKDRSETIQAILTKAYHVNPALYDHSYHEHPPLDQTAEKETTAPSEEWDGISYILLLTPTDRFLWSGDVLMQEMKLNIQMGEARVRLIANGPHAKLDAAKQKFLQLFEAEEDEEPLLLEGQLQCFEEEIAHLDVVERELRRMALTITKMAETIVRSIDHVHHSLNKAPNSQELLEGWFLFVSELGQQAMRYISPGSRIAFNGMLTKLAISWVAFICDECDHKERKIFRWAINALEFALFRTRRSNILYLQKDQFKLLREKVASCMTLLMSHFDILGAKSSMEAKKQKLRLQELRREQALMGRGNKELNQGTLSRPQSPDPSKSGIYGALNAVYERKSRLSQDSVVEAIQGLDQQRQAADSEQHLVGRVLDVGRPEDRSLVDLVSSAAHISIRWQQGRFIGAGAFGSVYQGFNLSTGAVMAVKEIRYQEIASSNLLKQIKDELAVMEMLHHPNIVEFYGIEAQRDKVYIFEEFCQGGSLGKLLENGRIEDEGIVQVYAMQMLDGLAYLHSRGIIHRDLKPDS